MEIVFERQKVLKINKLKNTLILMFIFAFQFSCMDSADKKEIEQHFKKLNEHLCRQSYLAGDKITAADVLLFHGIHHFYLEMTYQEKDKFLNLSRWFRDLQQNAKLRRGKSLISFSRSKLY